jgi:uncharacterized protein YjbJ (UPF0337 family)
MEMNLDPVIGEGRNLGGKVKEGVGNATGDSLLQADGLVDQLGGRLHKSLGSAKEAIGPLAGQARRFARERPWTTAALLGTIGLALINTLRGRSAKS